MKLNNEQAREYRSLRRKLNTAASVDAAKGIYNKVLELLGTGIEIEPVNLKQHVKDYLHKLKEEGINTDIHEVYLAGFELAAVIVQNGLDNGIITEEQAFELIEFHINKEVKRIKSIETHV